MFEDATIAAFTLNMANKKQCLKLGCGCGSRMLSQRWHGILASGAMYMRDPVVPVRLYSFSDLPILKPSPRPCSVPAAKTDYP